MYCHCGVEVHPKRVEFLKKANKPITCLEHSATQKVGGFMAIEGKTDRQIVIAEMDVIENLNRLSARAGTGVSKGVKMNQSFSAKHFK